MSPQIPAIRAQHKGRVAADLDQGGEGADALAAVLYLGDLKGQEEDKGDLDDLVGLDLHGEARDVQPVQVPRVVVVAQGGEQQEQEEYAAPKEPLPVFFHNS